MGPQYFAAGSGGTTIGGAPTQMRYGRVLVSCDGTANGKVFNYSSPFTTATDAVIIVQNAHGSTNAANTYFVFDSASGFSINVLNLWPASPATIGFDYIAFGH